MVVFPVLALLTQKSNFVVILVCLINICSILAASISIHKLIDNEQHPASYYIINLTPFSVILAIGSYVLYAILHKFSDIRLFELFLLFFEKNQV